MVAGKDPRVEGEKEVDCARPIEDRRCAVVVVCAGGVVAGGKQREDVRVDVCAAAAEIKGESLEDDLQQIVEMTPDGARLP